MDFRNQHSFEARAAEAIRIREKFPGRIPIIVQRATRDKVLPTIDKNKFLVPAELTMGQFVFVIRKRITLPPEQALFVFCGDSLPTTGSLMREMYTKYCDNDGFLYMTYCGENTFGFI